MTRVDLYGVVHKGIVTELFEATASVARTDFSRVWEVAPAVSRVHRLLAFLEDHADAQKQFLMPELDRISPVLASELRGDHARLHGLEREIWDLLSRIETAPQIEHRSLGYRLHHGLRRLVTEHLLHMEREETMANRALWAHRSDEQLRTIRSRMLASIPRERLVEWTSLVLRSTSCAERNEITAELGLPGNRPNPAVPNSSGPVSQGAPR